MLRALFYTSALILMIALGTYIAKAQKPVILENHPPLDRSKNLIFNGSFEEPRLTGGALGFATFDGTDGDGYYYFSTGTVNTPFALPDGWTSSGGGTQTYAIWGNNFEEKVLTPTFTAPETGIAYSDPDKHGDRALYFGNFHVLSISETPTFAPNGEVIFTNHPTIILRPGYGTGLTLTQNVTGLIPGERYRLSFWTSSEWASGVFVEFDFFREDGIFGLQIEGYELLYLTTPAGASAPPGVTTVFGLDESHTYVVEFVATQEEMEISFINWGHYAPSTTAGWTRGLTTEYVMDDVILNLVEDNTAAIPTASEWGLIFMSVFMGLIAVYMLRNRTRRPA